MATVLELLRKSKPLSDKAAGDVAFYEAAEQVAGEALDELTLYPSPATVDRTIRNLLELFDGPEPLLVAAIAHYKERTRDGLRVQEEAEAARRAFDEMARWANEAISAGNAVMASIPPELERQAVGRLERAIRAGVPGVRRLVEVALGVNDATTAALAFVARDLVEDISLPVGPREELAAFVAAVKDPIVAAAEVFEREIQNAREQSVGYVSYLVQEPAQPLDAAQVA